MGEVAWTHTLSASGWLPGHFSSYVVSLQNKVQRYSLGLFLGYQHTL